MGKGLWKGTLYGGIVAFVWLWISWMFIPWHNATINKFENPQAVADVITANAPKSGVYMLPCCMDNTMQWQKGPALFGAVQLKGGHGLGLGLPLSIITQFVSAFLVTLILSKMAISAYWCKVFASTLIGLAAGVIALVPLWNWMGLSGNYVAVEMADHVITWFLAGLAIAAVIKPCGSCCTKG